MSNLLLQGALRLAGAQKCQTACGSQEALHHTRPKAAPSASSAPSAHSYMNPIEKSCLAGQVFIHQLIWQTGLRVAQLQINLQKRDILAYKVCKSTFFLTPHGTPSRGNAADPAHQEGTPSRGHVQDNAALNSVIGRTVSEARVDYKDCVLCVCTVSCILWHVFSSYTGPHHRYPLPEFVPSSKLIVICSPLESGVFT